MKISKNDYGYILFWAKKIKMVSLMGGKCSKCGKDDIFVLEFHHPNDDKSDNVKSKMTQRLSRLELEVKKCILLCGNCHAELHYNDGGFNRRRSLLKEILLKYKNIFSCEKCGYNGKSYRSLEFHHKNPEDKSFEITEEIWKKGSSKKWTVCDKIANELDKCEVICRNCHGKEHTNIEKFKTLEELINKKVINYKEVKSLNKDDVIKMHNEGMRNIDIARSLKCSKSSITYLLQKYVD